MPHSHPSLRYGPPPFWGLDAGRVQFRPAASQEQRGPKHYVRSDERVAEDIHERLHRHALIDSREVTICVRKGEVTLEGTVPERWMKHAIDDIASNVAGVREVRNRIRVRDHSQ